MYRKLRPGEPPTVDSANTHINNLFFDAKRYDLARFGRYKYNKKLGVASRIAGHKAAQPIIDPTTGEILVDENEFINAEKAQAVEQAGVKECVIFSEEK